MKRFTRHLAVALAIVIGTVAFAPSDASAKNRHHRRHAAHHVHRHHQHGHNLHGHYRYNHHLHEHGNVAFAYYDAYRRPIYRDHRGYFYFGPGGGHVHFHPEPGGALLNIMIGR